MASVEHLDVLIIGAGISGIGAAYHLQTECPHHRYAILERRQAIGGTWDLFRYPGIRSDSDMHTLGYAFRPWTDGAKLADGDSILRYLEDTAEQYGIDQRIRFGLRVIRAAWSTAEGCWTVEAIEESTGETVHLTCAFLYMCTGYYDYDQGHSPCFMGQERFQGRIVHPQQWTDDIEYDGKKVVVIGSGATAVTLVPAMAKTAAHVTMLQRSPSYIMSIPNEDAIAKRLRSLLPEGLAHSLIRWKNILVALLFYNLCRWMPQQMKRWMMSLVEKQLGEGHDIETHFNPRYDPWDQRVCFVPNGDLFSAIRRGSASVVTDRIESFTENGIALSSGRELAADLIVTATGLKVLPLAGLAIEVDGETIDLSKTMAYRSLMFSDVPNLALAFGYTNASWTLKADLISEFVCRVLQHMRHGGHKKCVPVLDDPRVTDEPFVDLTSGYIQRSLHQLPRQGSRMPWRSHQNYLLDLLSLRHSRIDDGVLRFS